MTYRETVAKRLNTCRACTASRVYPAIGMVCGRLMVDTGDTCGCIIAVKARLLPFKCPQGKWENEHNTNTETMN